MDPIRLPRPQAALIVLGLLLAQHGGGISSSLLLPTYLLAHLPPHSPVRASPLLTLISVMTASQLIVQFCVLALVCLFPASTSALPAHSVSTIPSKRSTITTLTSTQVSSYTPYAYYAAAGYCKPNTTITWSCGLNCNATSTFIPVASGGDEDSSTPRYCEYPVLLLLFLVALSGSGWRIGYVGYDSALKEVVVGHQGTLKSNM